MNVSHAATDLLDRRHDTHVGASDDVRTNDPSPADPVDT